MLALVLVTWPDGSKAALDVVGYCMLSSKILEGTHVSFLSERREDEEAVRSPEETQG